MPYRFEDYAIQTGLLNSGEGYFAAIEEFAETLGMKAASEASRWTFPAPIGYRTVTTNGTSRLELDPIRAPLIKLAFELFASGRDRQEQVLKKVTGQGLKTRRDKKLSVQTFNALLRKPIYAGRICLEKTEKKQ